MRKIFLCLGTLKMGSMCCSCQFQIWCCPWIMIMIRAFNEEILLLNFLNSNKKDVNFAKNFVSKKID